MLIPEDMRWDEIEEDSSYSVSKTPLGHDRIRFLYEQEYDQPWAQLLAPNIDALAATKEFLAYIADVGEDIDQWPDDYDSAPLLRRCARIQHKHL